ncbi:hypothetical protein LZ32DRAFT_623845 [Colletotrichum eremochloae]|nr:hypothetical protein LZ32DRAFT_623845 [Colletotrichum eremochloae]
MPQKTRLKICHTGSYRYLRNDTWQGLPTPWRPRQGTRLWAPIALGSDETTREARSSACREMQYYPPARASPRKCAGILGALGIDPRPPQPRPVSRVGGFPSRSSDLHRVCVGVTPSFQHGHFFQFLSNQRRAQQDRPASSHSIGGFAFSRGVHLAPALLIAIHLQGNKTAGYGIPDEGYATDATKHASCCIEMNDLFTKTHNAA